MLGGPPRYSGECAGDRSALLHMHAGRAVDDVLVYSPIGSVVEPGKPMPRWGWEGLEA